MTIDERIAFLVQSTESLHSTAALHTGQIQKLAETVDRLGVRIDALTRAVEMDAENIRSLARIAEAHENRLDDHEHRLDNLESGG